MAQDIFGVPLIFTEYNPSYPAAEIHAVDNDDDTNFRPLYFKDGLSHCCPHFHCIANYQDLPRRLCLCAMHEFAEDSSCETYPDFCPGCHSPVPTRNSFKYIVTKHMPMMERYIFTTEHKWHKLPASTDTTKIYYSFRLRYQQRISGLFLRRNFFNILIVHPYHNAYRSHHQTFRYLPRNIGINLLLERILTEAVHELEEDLKLRKPFHCMCSSSTTTTSTTTTSTTTTSTTTSQRYAVPASTSSSTTPTPGTTHDAVPTSASSSVTHGHAVSESPSTSGATTSTVSVTDEDMEIPQ